MVNGLPKNFGERFGVMETKINFMKEKLDKVEPADIDNLKKDMTLIKRIGGTILGGGIIAAISVVFRKLLNGG